MISDTPSNGYLAGTTYWINDFLHVGHVHYDIALVEALSKIKVDRVVMQRAVCNGILCSGVGTMDSFYKGKFSLVYTLTFILMYFITCSGYFAAVFETAGQPKIPVYLRWEWKSLHVAPFYFSVNTDDYYYDAEFGKQQSRPTIKLKKIMCFERLLIRSDLKLGSIAAVSSDTVQRFIQVAYKMIRANPPLSTAFTRNGPFKILVSYRGPTASRNIRNLDAFVGQLHKTFPVAAGYQIRTLNNSDPFLDLPTQLIAVAESHVVITNHGAFEGNMIYMKNSSLLLEIYGNYFTAEVHTFHRLALMYGLYYARVHPANMTAHQQSSFELSQGEMHDYIAIVKDYFDRKAYLLNSAD